MQDASHLGCPGCERLKKKKKPNELALECDLQGSDAGSRLLASVNHGPTNTVALLRRNKFARHDRHEFVVRVGQRKRCAIVI